MTDDNEIYFKYQITKDFIQVESKDIPLDLEPCSVNIINKTQVINGLKKSILDIINGEEYNNLPIYKFYKIKKKLEKIIRK